MEKMFKKFASATLSRVQMKAIQGGKFDAEAEVACDETFTLKCTGGTQCNSEAGRWCECKDNNGDSVDYKECIQQ